MQNTNVIRPVPTYKAPLVDFSLAPKTQDAIVGNNDVLGDTGREGAVWTQKRKKSIEDEIQPIEEEEYIDFTPPKEDKKKKFRKLSKAKFEMMMEEIRREGDEKQKWLLKRHEKMTLPWQSRIRLAKKWNEQKKAKFAERVADSGSGN